jgi:hypothetical protein
VGLHVRNSPELQHYRAAVMSRLLCTFVDFMPCQFHELHVNYFPVQYNILLYEH